MLIEHLFFLLSRGEATRTPDLYVPNVARYQLRYTPIPFAVTKLIQIIQTAKYFYANYCFVISKGEFTD